MSEIEKEQGALEKGAQSYASNGLSVFPLRVGGKEPKVGGGYKSASSDPDEIRAWWEQWPDANIGLAIPPTLVVVDVDGEDALVIDQGLELPPTATVRTGRGRHYYYEMPDGVDSCNRQGFLEKVDIRGYGGYVVAPPSYHAEMAVDYVWEVPLEEIAPAPPWVVEACRGPRPAGAKHAMPPGAKLKIAPPLPESLGDPEGGLPAKLKGVWGEIPKGQRQQAAMAMAGALVREGMAPSQVEEVVRKVARLAGDEEAAKRGDPAKYVEQRLERGEPVLGVPTLLSLLSPDGIRQLDEVLMGPSCLLQQPLTDYGNAERFRLRQGERVLFTEDGTWRIWQDGCWVEDLALVRMRLFVETMREMGRQAEKEPDTARRTMLVKFARGAENKQQILAALGLYPSLKGVMAPVELLDSDPLLLNARNGTIDLEAGILRPHDPKDYCSLQIPVAYDPEAKAPAWTQFLEEAFEADAEIISFMQRLMGSMLTGLNDEQAFYFFLGRGGNGKTTFLEPFMAMLGPYAATVAPETFQGRERAAGAPSEDLVRLRGKRLAATSEPCRGTRFDESLLKRITGGEKLVARGLYKKPSEYVVRFKVVILANDLPAFSPGDEGLARRFLAVPFPVTFGEGRRDRHLGEKLKAELPGILNWALAGCLEYLGSGLQPPRRIVEGSRACLRGDGDIDAYLGSCCVSGSGYKATGGDLYKYYQKFCKETGSSPVAMKEFSRSLLERGALKRKTGGRMIYRGVGLRGEEGGREPITYSPDDLRDDYGKLSVLPPQPPSDWKDGDPSPSEPSPTTPHPRLAGPEP